MGGELDALFDEPAANDHDVAASYVARRIGLARCRPRTSRRRKGLSAYASLRILESLGGRRAAAGGGVPVHVPGVDVLAFTGTGPGTLPLVIVGLVTPVVGWFAVAFGKRGAAQPSGGGASPLRDLSHLASGPIH